MRQHNCDVIVATATVDEPWCRSDAVASAAAKSFVVVIVVVVAMQHLLDCPKKVVKQYKVDKIDRAADGANVIHCYILNGNQNL